MNDVTTGTCDATFLMSLMMFYWVSCSLSGHRLAGISGTELSWNIISFFLTQTRLKFPFTGEVELDDVQCCIEGVIVLELFAYETIVKAQEPESSPLLTGMH